MSRWPAVAQMAEVAQMGLWAAAETCAFWPLGPRRAPCAPLATWASWATSATWETCATWATEETWETWAVPCHLG